MSGKKGHKGRGKQFSNPEEIDRQMRAEREKEANGGAEPENSSESEEESSDEEFDIVSAAVSCCASLPHPHTPPPNPKQQQKKKGVEGLIEIENPNRVSQKSKKVADLDVSAPKELSRREREEIEKQRAKERYMKLHLEGKTEQARADLARLAIIKKQREEAARKRDELRKAKEEEEAKSKR
ncbi:hypothetical protein JZ751_025266 [Albula glossodonta]|uniref:Casein kinase substrate phosphoprotein PP28 domain-containing protein n=1 Tax=Albula glossodonta TaxID=121402 RepID=A0A8T2NEX9_9TELE|nr:hypothetical protein JZ751_025266 [Albula glossodonta]